MVLDIAAVLPVVTGKLNDVSVSDEIKTELINEVFFVIKNYCNIIDIPDDLLYVAANMSVDLHKSNQLQSNTSIDGININLGAVSKIKMGDTDIQFTKKGNSLGGHSPDVDSIIFNYKAQLNRFRKLSWGS